MYSMVLLFIHLLLFQFVAVIIVIYSVIQSTKGFLLKLTDIQHMLQVTAGSIQEITRLASDDINSNRSTCLSKLDLCIINLNSIRNRISADQCRTIEHSIENLWHSFLSDNSTVVLTNFTYSAPPTTVW